MYLRGEGVKQNPIIPKMWLACHVLGDLGILGSGTSLRNKAQRLPFGASKKSPLVQCPVQQLIYPANISSGTHWHKANAG